MGKGIETQCSECPKLKKEVETFRAELKQLQQQKIQLEIDNSRILEQSVGIVETLKAESKNYKEKIVKLEYISTY